MNKKYEIQCAVREYTTKKGRRKVRLSIGFQREVMLDSDR